MCILWFALSSFRYHGRCDRVLGNLHLWDKQQLGVTDCYTFGGWFALCQSECGRIPPPWHDARSWTLDQQLWGQPRCCCCWEMWRECLNVSQSPLCLSRLCRIGPCMVTSLLMFFLFMNTICNLWCFCFFELKKTYFCPEWVFWPRSTMISVDFFCARNT